MGRFQNPRAGNQQWANTLRLKPPDPSAAGGFGRKRGELIGDLPPSNLERWPRQVGRRPSGLRYRRLLAGNGYAERLPGNYSTQGDRSQAVKLKETRFILYMYGRQELSTG